MIKRRRRRKRQILKLFTFAFSITDHSFGPLSVSVFLALFNVFLFDIDYNLFILCKHIILPLNSTSFIFFVLFFGFSRLIVIALYMFIQQYLKLSIENQKCNF